MEKTLLLNATYEPLRIISWRKAVTLVVLEKVEVIETYDRQIHSVSLSIPLPSIVRLVHIAKWRRIKVNFSRRNIYVRDNGTCQYCGKPLQHKDITYDHVIPKSQGGLTSWENVVTCCIRCNTKKGARTPQQARMQLLTIPKRPQWHHFFHDSIDSNRSPKGWRNYLY